MTDGQMKGNPISPFCNFVVTGDKNCRRKAFLSDTKQYASYLYFPREHKLDFALVSSLVLLLGARLKTLSVFHVLVTSSSIRLLH